MQLFKPATALLALLLCSMSALTDAHAQTIPSASLRGYGTVSATQESLPGGASRLTIRCENIDKARLVLAKYLSDVSLLPPEDLSRIAAGRLDNRVFLCTDQSGKAASLLPNGAILESETTVPMWLDRWDRFGFRFYYRAWEMPSGQNIPPFDPLAEIDFARQTKTSLIFWAEQNQVDTAEFSMMDAWWDWAYREAKARNIPAGINPQTSQASWLVNRYRADTTYKAPQYIGGYYRVADPWIGGMGWFSWGSQKGADIQFGLLQTEIKKRADDPNVITILEPHGELKHGNHDLLLEYGPAADAAYRDFLKRRYKTLAALSDRWGEKFTDWNQVHLPELASFLGWGPDATDLTGKWKIAYEPFSDNRERPNWELQNQYRNHLPTIPAPQEWFAADFDDSAWPTVTAPGDEIAVLWPKRPVVFRRHINLSTLSGKRYLYIWSMNLGVDELIKASVNGKPVGESGIQWDAPSWCAFEVTDALKQGDNTIAIRIPKGAFGYRVYLSPHPPRQYPNLGASQNARWVDFCDGMADTRLRALKRGIEMIRQVDKNRQIVLMAPDPYGDGEKALARDYGGELHDTGYMSGFWADFDPMLMRSNQQPFSLEPGSPAGSLAELKKMTGLWLTEGTNGVDYFQHIGDIYNKPDHRAFFEENAELYHLFGKYHAPVASAAVLYSDRVQRLVGYPWKPEQNTVLQNGYWDMQGGYWRFNIAANLMRSVERDGLTEQDFPRGNASRYGIIFDSGTAVMDDELIGQVEKYVRAGGVFITFGQTGRHSPTVPDSWPITRLTGTKVVRIDPHDKDGNAKAAHKLQVSEGQTIFPADWNGVSANGLGLQKIAPEGKELLRWDDGTSAAILRPLGKGFVVHLGAKFSGDRIPDRIMGASESEADRTLTRLILALCDWRKIPRVAARVETGPSEHVLLRHYISNNGFWDVWVLWNESETASATARLAFNDAPAFCKEVKGAKVHPISGGGLPDIALSPSETRIFLTPRKSLSDAPLEWFTLQRNWWKASLKPGDFKLPAPERRWSLSLEDQWQIRPAADTDRLGIVRNNPTSKVVMKRSFTVPKDWKNGRTELWLNSFSGETFIGKGRVLLDGVVVQEPSVSGIAGLDMSKQLAPGSTHTLTVEVEGQGTVLGARGTCWLWHRPTADTSIDLAGEWTPTRDGINATTTVTLPGTWNGMTARRRILVPASAKGRTAMLALESDARIVGVVVNGAYVRRHHHIFGNRVDLNITPWLRFGEENDLELVTWESPTQGQVQSVRLDFFKPEEGYP